MFNLFNIKDDENEEELRAEQENTKQDEHRDERSQELDPLISKKVSTNGPVTFAEENENSSIELKRINSVQDEQSIQQPDAALMTSSSSDKTQYELQAQISTKSTRSGRRESAANDAPVNLSFFLQQHKDTSQRTLISPQISFVMFQFLFTTVRPFTSEFLTKNVLELIFKKATFKECKRMEKQQPEYLYK